MEADAVDAPLHRIAGQDQVRRAMAMALTFDRSSRVASIRARLR